MINWLIPFLSDLFSPFAAFSYIGVRAGAAFIFSFAVALVIGKPLIKRLRESKVGERTDNSDCDEVAEAYRQAGKDGTPTMGGVFW